MGCGDRDYYRRRADVGSVGHRSGWPGALLDMFWVYEGVGVMRDA